ncbi:MAG TPA: hypothetical protein VMG12_40590, partial [Polyangiaceae bacterium]|nr:hypothetical protein [Polyangiaceae bacterium]
MIGSGQNLAVWHEQLFASRAAEPRPAWLRDAYADPSAFWQQAAPELIAAAPGVSRSAVFQWYNLFHELGARHAVGPRAAHRDYSPGRGFRSETYAAVAQRAHALATAWRERGVVPGSAVCVVQNVGAAYVACSLAAFCCGATLTVLPPDGPSFVRRALRALIAAAEKAAPKAPAAPPAAGSPPPAGPPLFVVAGTTARPWVEHEPGVELLDWESAPSTGWTPLLEPHRYEASETAARLFSPLSAEWDTPVELSAEQLYLGALRDGLLLLGLEPGQGVAAPGFCEVQFKPALLLSALASGATWVELSLDELEDGRALFQGAIEVLGVSGPLRRLLVNGRSLNGKAPPSGRVKRWFRNLAEDSAIKAWTGFEAVMKEAGALGMQYFVSSAAGGSLLFSAWSAEPSSASVFRSPGLVCELSEPNGTGMPALADVGMLSPPAKAPAGKGVHVLPPSALGQLVIVETEASDLWVTNLGSHRRGVVLPEAQIEEVLSLKFVDAVRAAVLVVLPLAGENSGQRVALVVYARPGSLLSPGDLRQELEDELGTERVPDQIEVFELNPKLLDAKKDASEVDRPACRAEYLSGMSWRKSRCPVFSQLAALSSEVDAIRSHRQEMSARGE